MAITNRVSLLSISPAASAYREHQKNRRYLKSCIPELYRMQRALKIPQTTMLDALLQGKTTSKTAEDTLKGRITIAVNTMRGVSENLSTTIAKTKKQVKDAQLIKKHVSSSPQMYVDRDTANGHPLIALLQTELWAEPIANPYVSMNMGATNLTLLPLKLGNGDEALRVLGDFHVHIPCINNGEWLNVWNTKTGDWHKGDVVLPVKFGGLTINLATNILTCDTIRGAREMLRPVNNLVLHDVDADDTAGVALRNMASEISTSICALFGTVEHRVLKRTSVGLYPIPIDISDMPAYMHDLNPSVNTNPTVRRVLTYNPDTGKITTDDVKYVVAAETLALAEASIQHCAAGRGGRCIGPALRSGIENYGVPRAYAVDAGPLPSFAYPYTG